MQELAQKGHTRTNSYQCLTNENRLKTNKISVMTSWIKMIITRKNSNNVMDGERVSMSALLI